MRRVSFGQRVYRAGRNLPPVMSWETQKLLNVNVCACLVCCVPRRKKNISRRREREIEKKKEKRKKEGGERERECVGGQLSVGRNFKFEHPLSIKSVPLPEGTASMPCCSYTNFINHASQHTGGGGYPAGSLCPSYIFAYEIRSRETHRATDDWRM